jgi:hypothetical protein
MRHIMTPIYPYHELSDEAQHAAREEFRDHELPHHVQAGLDAVLYACAEVGTALGIEFDPRLEGEQRTPRASIWFQGFAAVYNNNGASFDGAWQRDHMRLAVAMNLANGDDKLHAIVATMQEFDLEASAVIKATSPTTVDITVDADDPSAIERAIRAFTAWMYDQLHAEFLERTSDEGIAARLAFESAEFTAEGARVVP